MNKILFFIGVALLVVPIGIRFVISGKQKELVTTYENQWEQIEESKMEACLDKARKYNDRLFEEGIIVKEQYEEQLDILGNGVMCSLEIPKISLKLPVHHGTEAEVLSGSIGHLKESSLPVGGVNSHCVLSGHRGLPNAELFTRLDELEKGDLFFVYVCNQKLGYQVSEIQVVEPDNAECIRIQKGKDLISLVTCTPYGINTHRLVITGERIHNWEVQDVEMTGQEISNRDKLYLLLPVIFIVTAFLKKKRKWIPFMLFGIIISCSMETLAAGNRMEVQIPADLKATILCAKVGEKVQSEYVLLEAFQDSGINLNHLHTAKEIQRAADKLSNYIEEGAVVPVDSNGCGVLEPLEDGVYLLKCQSETKNDMLPILIYLPAWSEDEGFWCPEVTVIPKLCKDKEIPDTGWDTNEMIYLALFSLSFGIIIKCYVKKHMRWKK